MIKKVGSDQIFLETVPFILQKMAKMTKYLVKSPVAKVELATEKPSIYAGLRRFWSKTHFFYLINTKKKLINI